MTNLSSYRDREWFPQPEAEDVLNKFLVPLLDACPRTLALRESLQSQCSIRLRDILDHIEFCDDTFVNEIEAAGWKNTSDTIWENDTGLFPAFVYHGGAPCLWMRVEDVRQFKETQTVETKIEGQENGLARRLKVFEGKSHSLGVFERNGYAGFDLPPVSDAEITMAMRHLQMFQSRRREFKSIEKGLAHTQALIDAAVNDIGPYWSCELWFKAERAYWLTRNVAGQWQKSRQDAMGVGWCNIDHHTYDSSRLHFRSTINILEKLGFELREMLYAGDLAGWGSQVLEHPALKSTIFADVDLAPDELDIDFSHEELSPLAKHRRAGLVSALHGESILEAGLNHVAGLYDRRSMHEQLSAAGFEIMAPFSNFENLYQELTVGDKAPIEPTRVDSLEQGGHINKEEADKIRQHGAIISHLENIERNAGFKGFNKLGIDGVLRKLDPRSKADST